MDNIYLTAEHELLRDQIARFLGREVEPHALAWEDAGLTPREVLRKLGAAGLLGLMYEGAYGGGDADALTNLVFAEALSQSTFGGFIITVLVHTDMASPHLHHAGSAAQRARWMPGITAGTTITAVAVTEPGAGSDVAGIRTTAARSADGSEWLLNGTKLFITNGVHADLVFVAARTGSARHAISIFAVEKGTPGFSVGRQLDKTGWLSSDTAELVFENCHIPAANLLGEEHRGFHAVMKNFQTERIALAAMAVGHSMQALRVTLEHVRDRRAFGATLFDMQVVRQRLAMLDARVRAARAFMYHCAWRVTRGDDVVQEISMLKALAGELVIEVVQACQQFHGGMGYMRGTVIERLWRDARVLAIGGGATEVMLDEVAKRY
ncbi:MAG TPA: acyl-CoA dehydrogenase family protein [Caldimonas sp.]|nr:acyl-CoA dehydrogenase family protein [Caldimonas sp.]HEX4233104.1 acyl-CoA dehydrogenase family protein [Caldimonas sp.]